MPAKIPLPGWISALIISRVALASTSVKEKNSSRLLNGFTAPVDLNDQTNGRDDLHDLFLCGS